jgi:hypothetical protein
MSAKTQSIKAFKTQIIPEYNDVKFGKFQQASDNLIDNVQMQLFVSTSIPAISRRQVVTIQTISRMRMVVIAYNFQNTIISITLNLPKIKCIILHQLKPYRCLSLSSDDVPRSVPRPALLAASARRPLKAHRYLPAKR